MQETTAKKPNRAAVQADRAQHELRRRLAEVKGTLLDVAERGVSMLALSGGFDSGSNDNRLRAGRPKGGLAGAGGSAWSQRHSWGLDRVRRYCQAMLRDNPLAGAMVQSAVDLDLRDGFSTRAVSGDRGWDKRADELFERWAYDPAMCDLSGALSLDGYAAAAIVAWFGEGDIVVNLVDEAEGRLQAIEAERVKNPAGKWDQKTCVGGVQFDDSGRPLGVHVAEWGANGGYTEVATRFLPRGTYLHCKNPMDCGAGVVRPVPQLQAVVKRLEDIDSVEEAVRAAIWVQACLAAFIKVNDPIAHQAGAMGTEEEAGTGEGGEPLTKKIETFLPAMIKYLEPNEDVTTLAPSQPGSQYETYIRTQLVMIGANLGIPSCCALMDGVGLNLSTIRSVIQLAWRRAVRRQEALKWGFYCPVRVWWTARAIARGELPFNQGWQKVDVIGPPAPVMDPKTEIEGAKLAIDSRLTSRPREAMRIYGTDVADTDAEQAESEARLKELGIPVVGLPGAQAGTEGQRDKGTEGGNREGSDAEGAGDAEPKLGPDGKPVAAAPGGGAKKGGEGFGGYLVGDKTLAGDMVTKVSGGQIPGESAKAVLEELVGLSPQQSARIIGPAETFEVEPPEPEVQTSAPGGPSGVAGAAAPAQQQSAGGDSTT